MTSTMTSNAYWDAVKGHVNPTGSLWRTPEVGGLPADGDYDRWVRDTPQRREFVARYSWTITDPATVAFVAEHSGGRMVDPMAGTGWWAHLLAGLGVDVVCSDVDPGGNQWHNGQALWVPVAGREAYDAVAEHPDRVLFLSWPPYDTRDGVDTVRAYPGPRVIAIHEGEGGCVGDDALFAELASNWPAAVVVASADRTGVAAGDDVAAGGDVLVEGGGVCASRTEGAAVTGPTTDALVRHVAAQILVDWLRQHEVPERWVLAAALGRAADEYGREDLTCDPDSPEVAAVEAALRSLAAELTRSAYWAPPGQGARDERLLLRLTASGEQLRDAGLWFEELGDWFRAHLEHRRDRPAKVDDPVRLADLARGLWSHGDPGE